MGFKAFDGKKCVLYSNFRSHFITGNRDGSNYNMNNDINEYLCGQGSGADINTDQIVRAKRGETFIIRPANSTGHERPGILASRENTNISKARILKRENFQQFLVCWALVC